MSRSCLLRGLPVALALLVIPSLANATLIELPDVFGTGLKGDGTLAAGGGLDLHYYFYNAPISGDASYSSYPSPYVTNESQTPWPTTYASGTMNPDYAVLARWISPRAGYPLSNDQDPAGDYVYRTTFTVPFNTYSNSVLLYGSISSDNCTSGVSINGHAVSNWSMTTGTCINQAHYFQIGGQDAAFLSGTGLATGLQLRSEWFKQGTNTIDFIVNNAAGATFNPGGMVVWLDGHATEMHAPEPGSIMLVLAGFAGLLIFRKRLS